MSGIFIAGINEITKDVLEAKDIFCTFYSDRGSHYWHTPEAGGKVDKNNPTQFGVALKRLGIDMIAAYSPEARGRSERAFGAHQGRLPQELAINGITDIKAANDYLKNHYLPAFNEEFAHPAREAGNALEKNGTLKKMGRYPYSLFGGMTGRGV